MLYFVKTGWYWYSFYILETFYHQNINSKLDSKHSLFLYYNTLDTSYMAVHSWITQNRGNRPSQKLLTSLVFLYNEAMLLILSFPLRCTSFFWITEIHSQKRLTKIYFVTIQKIVLLQMSHITLPLDQFEKAYIWTIFISLEQGESNGIGFQS